MRRRPPAGPAGPDDRRRPGTSCRTRTSPSISTPGTYATAEALRALKRGLNVFLFSDNVALEDEIRLKGLGRCARGCWSWVPTAARRSSAGVPLGFANAVRRGPIGLVGASGTGLQQVTSLIDRLGSGVSQAFGTGGRDLDERVGGATMLAAIAAAPGRSDATEVIVLISKPPSAVVARSDPRRRRGRRRSRSSSTSSAAIPTRCRGGRRVPRRDARSGRAARGRRSAARRPGRGRCCGDLADAARSIRMLGRSADDGRRAAGARPDARSAACTPAARSPARRSSCSRDGPRARAPRPDPRPRRRRVHRRPAAPDDRSAAAQRARSSRRPPIRRSPSCCSTSSSATARTRTRPRRSRRPSPTRWRSRSSAGRHLLVVASVCGTDLDPQGLARQERILAQTGVMLEVEQRPGREARGDDRRGPPERASPSPARRSSERPTDGARGPDRRLTAGVRAINVGVAEFADPIRAAGAPVVALDWRPPADGDRELGLLLAALEDDPGDPVGARDRGRERAGRRADPRRPADARRRATGASRRSRARPTDAPPQRPADRVGPRCAARSRGPRSARACSRAGPTTPEDAAGCSTRRDRLRAVPRPRRGRPDGRRPVADHAGRGGRERGRGGNRAFATLNEGLGKVLRFGAYDRRCIERLRWLADDARAGALDARSSRAARSTCGALTAQALQMGDECHNRNVAATSLFARTIAPTAGRASLERRRRRPRCSTSSRENDHFFLNLSMAACKSALDAAHGIDGSTVVTAMARNGVDFGIRLSGTGDAWFTAPVDGPGRPVLPGLRPRRRQPRPGRQRDHRDVRDRRLRDGGRPGHRPVRRRHAGRRARLHPRDGADHPRPKNADLALPPLGFVGTPTGIDARRVVESGHRAGHQHRHRPPRAGHRPDRGRDRPRAAGLLRGSRSGPSRAELRDRSRGVTARRAVVAIGGNALILDGQRGTIAEQFDERPSETARHIAALVADGWRVVLTHGNGPQVGFILLRSELVGEDAPVPRLSLDMAVADSLGGVGYIIGNCAAERARRLRAGRPRGLRPDPDRRRCRPIRPSATRPSRSGRPTRPTRPTRSEREEGWAMVEDSGPRLPPGRGLAASRCGSSSRRQIRALVDAGFVVVAVRRRRHPGRRDEPRRLRGRRGGHRQGLRVGAAGGQPRRATLVLSTGVEQVAWQFRQPDQRFLDSMTAAEATAVPRRRRVPRGQHGTEDRGGRRLPRPRRKGGHHHVAGRTWSEAIAGQTGTRIVADADSRRIRSDPEQRGGRHGNRRGGAVRVRFRDPATTALVMIDFQRDFVYPGGFGEALGNDTSPLLRGAPAGRSAS